MTPEEKKEYYRNRKYPETRQRYYENNKEQFAERSKAWYSNPDNKRRLREKKFGVKLEDLILAQDNKCGICHEEFTDYSKVHIDHDHITGKVRGLLCRQHNRGLGFFNDDPQLLLAAWIWLRKERE